ncbi:MAG: hypothetical protein ACFB9M_20985 [Myxococcota bacterium]
MITTVLIWGFATAAPFSSYGGELRIEDQARTNRPTCHPLSLSDTVSQHAAFEPLFDAHGQPVLARGVPAADHDGAGEVEIQLRTQVRLHDGGVLTADHVVEALVLAARNGCLDLLPLLDGEPEQAIESDPVLASVRIQLRHRPSGWPALLSSAPIAIRKESVWLGTGPFSFGTDRLVAFPAHRSGRPFLDAIVFAPSGMAARASESGSYVADTYLQIDAGSDVVRFIRAVVDPEALVGFVPYSARPARTLRGPLPEVPARNVFDLDVPADGAVPQRVLERLQLDLARAGLSVTLRRRASGPESDLRILRVWSDTQTPPFLRQLRPLHNRLPPDQLREAILSGSVSRLQATAVEAGILPLYSVHYRVPQPLAQTSELADWSDPRRPGHLRP